MTFYNGDTSGWMAVTEMSALVFPAKRTLVREKIAEGWFENGLRFGPYPKDRLAYKNATTVYYTTPPDSEGLGTHWGPFKPSEHPIRGLAMLAEVTRPPSLVFLAVRLPPEMADLTSTIIEEIRTYYVTKERRFRQLLRQAGAPP